MRRRRIRRNQNKTARKIVLRVLYVILVAAVVFALAVVLGNYLGSIADKLPEDTSSGDGTADTDEGTHDDEIRVDLAEGMLKLDGAAVWLQSVKGEDDILAAAESVKTYDTALMRLTRDGAMLYESPAVFGSVGLGDRGDREALELIRECVRYLEQRNLMTAALIESMNGKLFDNLGMTRALLSEASDAGFDLLLLEAGSDRIGELCEFIESLELSAKFGIILDAEVIAEADIHELQRLAGIVDFMGAHFVADPLAPPATLYADTYHTVSGMLTEFNLYGISAVIEAGSLEAEEEIIRACRDLGVTGIIRTEVHETEPEDTEETAVAIIVD